jgi:hypothetical protein
VDCQKWGGSPLCGADPARAAALLQDFGAFWSAATREERKRIYSAPGCWTPAEFETAFRVQDASDPGDSNTPLRILCNQLR